MSQLVMSSVLLMLLPEQAHQDVKCAKVLVSVVPVD
jgi:hypothetical protein